MNSWSKSAPALVGLAAVLLTACQSTPTRIYTLYPVAAVGPRAGYDGPPVRVDAVHFPPAWDRIEVVRDSARGEMSLSDVDHWSAPLGQAAKQALSADLALRLPPGKAIFPHLAKPAGALGVTVDVLYLNTDRQGVSLEAGWVTSVSGGTLASGPAITTLRTEAPGTNAAATAQALSTLLGQLADRIAAGL